MDNPGEILRLCRLCLVKDQVNIPIFEEQGDIRQIFLKISSCLPVKVSRDDKLPKKICDGCSNKLDLLYDFWNSSANAEKTLLSWLGQAGVKDADETISAVAQQIAKPAETQVKQEALEDGHAASQAQSYGVQSFDEEAKDESEAPPPKRARRTAAVKAQISITPESDDDDDMDSAEAMTKVEDESDESDGEDKDPSYAEVPGTSADDQAGPSGVGKDGVEAPVFIKVEKNEHVCPTCLQSFATPEELTHHSQNIKIKIICYCATCENDVDPDFSCDHSPIEKSYICFLCKSNLEYLKLKDHLCFHGHCPSCLQSFLTLEELYGHVKIKTMCMCNTCGNFFGTNECRHSSTAKTFFCIHCGLTLHHSELQEHLCFHGKSLRVRRKEEFAEDEITEQRSKRSEPKSLVGIYSRVKHRYVRAKKIYLEEVNKIREGYYESHRYIDMYKGSESETEDKDTLSIEVSGEETAPCVFCLDEVSLPILTKHEARCIPRRKHRIVDQPIQRNPAESFQEKKILCYVCGGFYRSCKFRFHMLTHKKAKPVLCEICGVPSKCIKVHMTKHSDKRNFSCDKCGMAFKTSKTLAVHSLVHTKVGTHKCPTCEKLFKNAYNLRVHIRTHMDKKPFECAICEKSFTTKQWRDNHVKTHK